MRTTVRMVWTALWLLCPATAVAQETRVEVYKAQHRLAEELGPVAEAVIKDTGSVTVDPRTNSLILVAPGGRMELVLQVLAQQDVPPRTVVVEYRSVRRAELERSGMDIRWSIDAGDVQVGNVPRPGGGDQAALALYADWIQRQGEFSSMLRLLEASSGQIHTGTSRPVGGPGGVFYAGAFSGFDVTPRILGDGRVRLELAPLQEAHGPGGTIHSTSGFSTVDVVPGDLVVLARLEEDTSTSGAGTSGLRRSEAEDEHVLLLRVRVE